MQSGLLIISMYLLANMASHPQYTGSRLHLLKDDPFGAFRHKCIDFIKKHRQKIISLKSIYFRV